MSRTPSIIGHRSLGVAVAGYAWLMLRHRRAALVLLAPLGLALLSLLFAQRFLIFVAPVTGLGIGYLAARGVAAVGRAWWLRGVVAVGVVSAAGPSLARDMSIDFVPAAGADLVSGMRWVSDNLPPDAVVWAQWDFGYTLRYWGRRATVNDGSTHTGELTRRIAAHKGNVFAIAFDARGERLATGGEDKKIRVWRVSAPEHEKTR